MLGNPGTLTDRRTSKKTWLSGAQILSQCYDGTSLMSQTHGGAQKLPQDRLGREIPSIHCFNHQLHLLDIRALSTEEAIDFSNVCGVSKGMLLKCPQKAHRVLAL